MTGHPSAFIPKDIVATYEVHNFRHAAEVLGTSCAKEFDEVLAALRSFRLTLADIVKAGGNETEIVKRFTNLLRPKGWLETRIHADLVVTLEAGKEKRRDRDEENGDEEDLQVEQTRTVTRPRLIDGHKIDFVKNRVAFDLEWNSKDQTFDRDLYAFRTFHECGLIDAAVLVTRSAELNKVFESLGADRDKDGNVKLKKSGKPKLIKEKYGASTTWMGKLLYRLEAGRNGGCPVLAFGMTKRVISDWKEPK